jgi:hypothetical protein
MQWFSAKQYFGRIYMECVKDGIYNKLDFYEAIIIVNDLYNILLRKLVINKTFQTNMDQTKSRLDAFVQF